AFGVRGGYRITTVIGLELSFQYGAAGGSGTTQVSGASEESEYSVASVRLGGNMRFMTKGKVARFVGTVGAGLAYDSLSFTHCDLCDVLDGDGAGFYVLLEPGFELDFSGFIVGVALPVMPSFGKGGENEQNQSTLEEGLTQAGIMLRAGYGRW